MKYNWINNVAKISDDCISITFNSEFNQKIDLKILPSKLKHIEFDWIYLLCDKIDILSYVEMVNDIPNYYDVKLLATDNFFGNTSPKWPIHVLWTCYNKSQWSFKLYEVIDNYMHPIYGKMIVLINKESYQPYSSVKSALK